MSIAVTDLPATKRVKPLDLAGMPQDRIAIRAAKRALSTRDFGAWTILREYLWQYGSLPVDQGELAKLIGTRAPTFARMAQALAAHFDRATDGAWTDRRLLQQRRAE